MKPAKSHPDYEQLCHEMKWLHESPHLRKDGPTCIVLAVVEKSSSIRMFSREPPASASCRTRARRRLAAKRGGLFSLPRETCIIASSLTIDFTRSSCRVLHPCLS